MMVRFKLACGLLLGAVLAASVAALGSAQTEKKAPKEAQMAFDRLKKLVGDWQLAEPKEEATRGKAVVRYRLTAGKSVLVETLFPDDDKEMLTIYHLDGDHVVLTHYCCCGNQPRMQARNGGDRDELVFEFAGGGNLDAAKDMHMHDYRVRFVDADHLHGEWEYYMDGKAAGKHTFDLVRKK
jgi:hypothetical protein